MKNELSVMSLVDRLETEADAYAFLEELRWGGKPVCPHCGNDERSYFLKPRNGAARQTRTGAATQRRVWKCGACRKQYTVLVGTIFESTKISIRKWLFVFFEMCSSKNGISAREIERKYNLTPKSAWFMTQRIREAMRREPMAGMMRGTIVADETFFGGKPRKNHQHGTSTGGYSNRKRGGGTAHLQPVLSLVNTSTGEVRSAVVPDVTGATLRKVIAEQVDMAGSTLHTDAGKQYRPLGQEFIEHQWVDHSSNEYVRYSPNGVITSNQAEGYFSQLKRSIDGTHHHVSREHLPRYLAEFDFRYSTRKMTDSDRMRRLIEQTEGRRLSYKPLTGRS